MNLDENALKWPFPISIAEMRERYLKLYTGAVNDVLRFKYKMHASSLPATFAPLRRNEIGRTGFYSQRRT